MKINGSVARHALRDLEEQGLIKKVVSHSKCTVYSKSSLSQPVMAYACCVCISSGCFPPASTRTKGKRRDANVRPLSSRYWRRCVVFALFAWWSGCWDRRCMRKQLCTWEAYMENSLPDYANEKPSATYVLTPCSCNVRGIIIRMKKPNED